MSALTALLVFLISFMLIAIFCKMPVSFALGTSSLLVLAYGGLKLSIVPQFAFSGLDSFALLAIPFYIFAGVLMEYSGISKMLIDWIKSFVGRVRGATGIITIDVYKRQVPDFCPAPSVSVRLSRRRSACALFTGLPEREPENFLLMNPGIPSISWDRWATAFRRKGRMSS